MKLTSNFYKLVVLTFLLFILLSDLIVKASWWYATQEAHRILVINPGFVADLDSYSQQAQSWDQRMSFIKPFETVTNGIHTVKGTIVWDVLMDLPQYGPTIKTADEILNGLVAAKNEVHGIASLDLVVVGSKQFLQDSGPVSLQNLASTCAERTRYLESLESGFKKIAGAANSLEELSNNFYSALEDGLKSNILGVPFASSTILNIFDPAFRNVKTLHTTMSQYEFQTRQDLATMNSLITITNKAQNVEHFFLYSPLRPFIAFVHRYFIVVFALLILLLLEEIRLLLGQRGLTLRQFTPLVLQSKQRIA